ncbi:hypothetical protein [Hyalangium versicolor]|uniref:hypothetical protein n=1 Tax=Hyalangium versicolor TaxID=2861190 RepID=UPI001CC9AC31|nr:hypothetical protein [Hyalangium versicolor]
MPQSEGPFRRLLTAAHHAMGVASGSVWLLATLLRSTRAGRERAQKNAEQIVAACRAFERKHGRLPTTLEELVPEFLPALPKALYDGPHFGFVYDVTPEPPRHVLGWTDRIPFGRPYYVFEEDRWGYLD